ncbi:MAG: hypothetical protein R3F49_17635 [Planctomycetota bacterium]
MLRTRTAFFVAALASACHSTTGPTYVDRDGWRTHEAFAGEVRLSGVACGDIDPRSPGDELVAVGELGRITYARCVGGAFESEVIAETGGELLQVAVGDVDRERPGAEIVAVGVLTGTEEELGEGAAWLLRRSADGAGGFEREVLAQSPALIHAVVIGDLDPATPGNEVALAGFTREVTLVTRTPEGFAARVIAKLPANAKGMAATARGLVVACDNGALVWLARPSEAGAEWNTARVWRGEAPLARVATRPDEVLVCGNDGVLRLFQTKSDEAFERETRCVALDDRLRGAVFADVDPRSPGTEAATAGYDGTVRVVRLEPWPVAADLVPASAGLVNYRVIEDIAAEDTAKLHHLASGRFDGLGTCLVSAGYSGRVLVVHRIAADVAR